MNKIKTIRINYYILLSVMIHSFLFLFIEKERDVTLGEKIIPIELVDDLSKAGFGEATKRSERLIKKVSLQEESQKENKNKKPLDQKKLFQDSKINNKLNEKKSKKKKSKHNNINQTTSKEEKGSGSITGIKSNEPEKGSLSGKGKIKVTCLKCIRPVYPPIALRRGAEGTPVVKVWINKEGRVYKAKLIRFSGNKPIDMAAEKAAINSFFYPLEKETSINIEYDLKIGK